MDYPPKQLSMRLVNDQQISLGEPAVPEGYCLRQFKPGDEIEWARLLVLGGFKDWDSHKIREYMKNLERLKGSAVIENNDRIVAVTFATPIESSPPVGALDFVVTHPSHRNLGLGRAVCSAVANFFLNSDYQSVYLTTDDWRLPAIRIYLALGFKPEFTRDDMKCRWKMVMKNLTESRID